MAVAGTARSFQLLAAVASLFSISSHAVKVARGTGCAPGQFPGPGSAPCAKNYRDSGHLFPLEKPTAYNHELTAVVNSGHTWPGCTCPMPMPGRIPEIVTTTRHFPVAPPPAGEVEVLTVDVRMANRVRCANESIAEAIASHLRIPVKRITVTPWSWVLPDQLEGQPHQSTYLAFVQEDHDRCGCDGGGGKVNEGQGFRLSQHSATEGWMLAPDTSVMTVSQFQKINGIVPSNPAAAAAAAAVNAVSGVAVPPPTPAPPPSSRVQMLTRDPCLVHLLRENTEYFHKRVANLLGVPEDKVIIDPPPVKGTVGLLQLDTKLNSEKEDRQVPVLGVRQCNPVSQVEMMQRLSLLDTNTEEAAPAPAPWGAPSPAMYPVFSIANFSNLTNASNVTNATNYTQRVSLVLKLHNMDYDVLAASWPLVSAFTNFVKMAIGGSGHIPPTAVKMGLYPGSVVVEAMITPPPDTAPAAVLAFLNDTVCNDTVNHLSSMAALNRTMTGPLNCSIVSLTLVDPPSDPPEENRAWIALWSIVVLPPFAEDAAWRLLQLVNEPMTELSKLLPLTLARIPGMKYRSLLEPNAAIHEANETRLPPPEDKAVGFALPNPYAEEAAIEFEMKRMKKENGERTMMVKSMTLMDNMKAQEMLRAAKAEQKAIEQANVKFTNAARAHASALRAANRTHGPDIVPYGVLHQHTGIHGENDHLLANESPYPFRDQMPPPGFMLDLVQEPQLKPAKRLRTQRKA